MRAPLWGVPVPVDPGEHVVEVSAPGKLGWRGTVTVSGTLSAAEIRVPVLADAPLGVASSPLVSGGEPERGSVQRWFGWSGVALGADGVVAGVVFRVRSSSKSHERDELCPADVCCSDAEEARVHALTDEVNTAATIRTRLARRGRAGRASAWLSRGARTDGYGNTAITAAITALHDVSPMSSPIVTRRRALSLAAGGAVWCVTGAGERAALAAAPPSKISPRATDVLLVVDVQNCFVPGGSLAVKDGQGIVPIINQLAKAFENVILTQDWHTPDHVSFASQHSGKKPFESVQLPYGAQTLWPDHCVQDTPGAALVPGLRVPHARLIVRKGFHKNVDSYSAFLEADKKTQTGLAGYLRGAGIQRVYLCGLATDYCVAWSALDARKFGFKAAVIEDACRGIDLSGSLEKAWQT